jgi:AcrR family transcriptional regulator
MPKPLNSRAEPIQSRARKQRENILRVTCELLKTVGLDDLTTILVAKEAGISVGTLYHYYPNKHAILYAVSEIWVDKVKGLIEDIESENLETIRLKPFVNDFVSRFTELYKDNSSLLPLIAVMPSMPELQPINNVYLELIRSKFIKILLRLPISLESDDAQHLAKFYWQICHSALYAVNCEELNAYKTVADLKYLLLSLLEKARINF